MQEDEHERQHIPPRRPKATLAIHRDADGGPWGPIDARLLGEQLEEKARPDAWPAAWERPAAHGAFDRYESPSRHGARAEGGGDAARPELVAFYEASKKRKEKAKDEQQVRAMLAEIPLIKQMMKKRRTREGRRVDTLTTTGMFLLEIVRALAASLMGSETAGEGRTGATLGKTKERTVYKKLADVFVAAMESPELGTSTGASFEVAESLGRTRAEWAWSRGHGPEMACHQSSNGAASARSQGAVERTITARAAIHLAMNPPLSTTRAPLDAVDLQSLIDLKVNKIPKAERLLAFRRRLLTYRGTDPASVCPASKAAPMRLELHALRRELADMQGMNALAMKPEATLKGSGAVEEDQRRRQEAARNMDAVVTVDAVPVGDPEIRPTLHRRLPGEIAREMFGNPHHWAWPDRLTIDDRLRVAEARREKRPVHKVETLTALRQAIDKLEAGLDRADRDDERLAAMAIQRATEDLTDQAIEQRVRRSHRRLEDSLMSPPEAGDADAVGLIPLPERVTRHSRPLPAPIAPRRLGDHLAL